MMRKNLLLAFGLALITGCSSSPGCGADKAAFLKGFHKMVDESAAAGLPVSDSRWEKYDERFRAYVEECYEQYETELSPKERHLFWSGAVKYYAQRYGKGVIKELGKQKNQTAAKVRKEVNDIWGDAKKALDEVNGKAKAEPLLERGATE